MGNATAKSDIGSEEEVIGLAVVCSRLFVQFLSVHLGEAEPIKDTPSTTFPSVFVSSDFAQLVLVWCVLSVGAI